MEIIQKTATLTLPAARAVASAASKKAEMLGCCVNVAVVDASGQLICFERKPGAFIESIGIAQDKAKTAAGFGMATENLAESFQRDDSLRIGIGGREGVAAFKGGYPIKVRDQIVGAIGVSGASDEQDSEIAKAGMAELESLVAEYDAVKPEPFQ